MRSPLLAVPLAAVLVVLGLAPARAESTSVRDGVGDVWAAADLGLDDYEPAGRVPNADLRRLRVDHTATDVVAEATLVDLAPGASDSVTLRVTVRTPGRTYVVRASTGDDLTEAAVVVRTGGADLACPAAHGAVDTSRRRLSLQVPRSCLGDPAWVRFRARLEAFDLRVGTYADDALSDRAAGRRWSGRLSAG